MKLRALYEAKWGWKQKGTTPPRNPTGIKKISRAEQAERAKSYSERVKARVSSADTIDPVEYDEDVSDRLLAQQAKINQARAKSRRTPKPLVQFPEEDL